ncbi:MAG: tetratricopeptide repeat protein [Deltaproteobacteria bacterium]|nr:tetratricopeptide repeat protein [Deltaproteobacteria bacterium]
MIDLVRRDPSSPAFIDLAEAYLNLGRPKDSITVCNQGLEVSPDNLEGRVMLARAHAALHQWKEAQGELLRVVKIDRSNRLGFALLGEVLLRRNDYERAVPVLQHAQNLDPTSPQILSMLKRARASQPLDPPPPIPQPVPPRGETNYNIAIEKPRPAPTPPRSAAMPVPASSPVAPTMALRPDPEPPPPRAHKPTAPPPPQQPVEGVRPRIVNAARPQNAAAASLRQSAAVGENYLNDLLTGGLLDVAGVRVPDSEFDLRPDRRWGRSTRRAFIFLFVVLVLGIGGGGTWYWWSEKQKSEAVAKLQKDAKTAIGAGDFNGLETSLTKLKQALEKDPGNLLTFTLAAEAGGLESLLYGTETERVDRAIKAAAPDVKPGQPGARELLIGKAAVELSRLGTLEAPASTLAEVTKQLDDYLAKNDSDKWVRWLKARAQLAGGEFKAAKATLKAAADGDDGVPVAMIDQADLLVDEGSLDEGLALYDKALAKSKDHPLAVLGKSLARAESSVQANDAIDDLNVKLDKNFGSRVTAYRNLALALAEAGIEDYVRSGDDLKKAVGSHPPTEPRFWARIAWAHYTRGELKQAAEARGKIAWYGKGKAEDDPAVQLVDAGLLLASGLPDKALDVASKLQGVRPGLIRAYAEIDLGKAKDALDDADKVLAKAPENLEAQIVREEARVVAATNDKERAAAADALEHLARKAKSKIGRHALGMALFLVGNAKDAQPQLEQAVADLTDDAPNPLAYRTYTALAEIAIANNDLKTAETDLNKALERNSGYFPTRALQAKVVLRGGNPDGALELLEPMLKETELPPSTELTLAEALITHKGAKQQDKDDAQKILEAIKDKVPPEEASRVAALIDPKLPEKLGLPKPAPEGAPAKPTGPAKAPPKKKGR